MYACIHAHCWDLTQFPVSYIILQGVSEIHILYNSSQVLWLDLFEDISSAKSGRTVETRQC